MKPKGIFAGILFFKVWMFGCFFTGNTVYGQYGTDAQIKNVDFELYNDKILITYDLLKAKPRERFDINVDIVNASGFNVKAKTLEGDFSYVKRGRNKEIYWHIGQDYTSFEDHIYVELTAVHKNYRRINEVTKLEALCKSTFWPGWGSAQTQLKKGNYLKGVLGYSFLVNGIVYHNKWMNASTDIWNTGSIGGLIDKADQIRDYQIISVASFGLAGLVWFWDYIKVLAAPNVSKNIRLDVQPQSNLNGINPSLCLTYKF